jgi:hypothetical protein
MSLGDRRQERASTRCVVQNGWLAVHHDEVIDDAGHRSDFWVVRRPSFVLVVPRHRDSGAVGLVHRFRYPVGLWFWEFPQRRLAASSPADVEATASALVRDLAGGDEPEVRLGLLGQFFEAYGFSDHQCFCYLAEVDSGPEGEADAQAAALSRAVRWESTASLFDRLASTEIADAATAAALALLVARDGGFRA